MKTVLEILQLATSHFQKVGLPASRRTAEEALAYILGIERLELYLQFSKPLSDAEISGIRALVARCARGEPIAQVIGHVKFFNLKLQVTPEVLVPRPETELLVERVLTGIDGEDKVLWDVGCGSGCIGLAIKKQIPSLRVIMSDLCPRALAVAKANAKQNDVEVEFRCGDLLTPFVGEKAHYVVSNPPYVREDEWAGLSASVREFEPRQALVAGSTGLEVYQRLATQLPSHLHEKAKIWFELGAGQGDSILGLFSQAPWSGALVAPDWAGHDRFFAVELEPLSALS